MDLGKDILDAPSRVEAAPSDGVWNWLTPKEKESIWEDVKSLESRLSAILCNDRVSVVLQRDW